MECNFGVYKDSAFLSTKILKIIEINNFFQQENQQFSKTVTSQQKRTKMHQKILKNDQADYAIT